jgi:hypothetical protein
MGSIDKHRENFYALDALAHKAMLYSNWAAPYQDPTYRAIAVVSTPSVARQLPAREGISAPRTRSPSSRRCSLTTASR